MSGDVETGSTRPRPLSGGFWTLLSWLRGDEHSASSDSISSVGSDRTAVSFAFFAPAHYRASAEPIVLPPPGPPTDSYKKRVRERNLRRQYERDITLHRKYGLFRGDGVSFDANSLPPPRRTGTVYDRKDRDRRAASECHQRRTAHVPGKRRAPPPPGGAALNNVVAPPTTVNRRQSRKRPAPKPPLQTTVRSIENISLREHNKINMNSSSSRSEPQPLALNSKQERYIKKDSDSKENKPRSEKSFLKQIFENKKKASVGTSLIKILPNISELDKQAAEIFETSKAKRQSEIIDINLHTPSAGNVWYCIKCSKWYDNGVKYCLLCNIKKDVSSPSALKQDRKNATAHTQTEVAAPGPSTSKTNEIEEKQKLKEMLKEMKDSLPKRTKIEINLNNKGQEKTKLSSVQPRKELILETPTLPIGQTVSVNKHEINKVPSPSLPQKIDNLNRPSKLYEKPVNLAEIQKSQRQPDRKVPQDKRKDLNTPLRISSLLNPIYIPKPNGLLQDQPDKNISSTETTKVEKVNQSNTDQIYVKTADAVRQILLNTASSSPAASSHVLKSRLCKEKSRGLDGKQSSSGIPPTQTPKDSNENDIQNINNHSRRRELVNQLEKSIAGGDERAAADAAMKLAQLRLSCSVLSFTSQILQQPQTNPNSDVKTSNVTSIVNDNKKSKPIVLPSNNRLLENNNKVSKAHDTHDAATSTNNVPLKKNGNVLSTYVKGSEEVTKPTLKNKEFPSKPLNNLTSNNSTYFPATAESSSNVTENKQNGPNREVLAGPSTSKGNNNPEENMKSIAVWVEDKEKAHGPIRLQVPRNAVLGDLRRRAEQALGLPLRLQRWIVGKELCNNDTTTLVSLAGPDLDIPFYLCVVECDKNVQSFIRNLCEVKAETKNEIGKSNDNSGENTSGVYKELVNLELQATVPNAEAFECEICMEQCAAGDGVVLRECVHSFCRQCLSDVIRHCEEPAVSCPAMGCPGLLHEREIRALVNLEDYERWLNRGLAAAESGTRNAFHCRTRDCAGWALCEAGARRFPCPVCKHINCVQCQAIHEGESCDQYRKKLEEAAKSTQATDEGTQALIESLIARGEALQCPQCSAVITKKWGCDWVKCSACKTEICWVTRGRRWGPAGRGDTSAGCRCGVDGKRCHPSCGYCH